MENGRLAFLAQVLTGPRQGYRLQKMSIRIPTGTYCHNIPTHTPQSGYHGVTELGRQKRQHTKNGWKMHKLHQHSSHPAPYKPHGVGTRKHFFGSKSKKTKRFMIFDPKKGGVHFFDIFDPPPHPPTPPSKPPKSGFEVGGGGGGSGPKTHWGMHLLDKIMILQGAKQTIQPLGVGYANRFKKAQNGGYVAFSPICACLALI